MPVDEKKVPFISPLWAVAKTDDKSEANVEWVQLAWDVSVVGQGSGKVAKKPPTIAIKVWALVNKRVIATDTELLVFSEKDEDNEPKKRKK